MVRKGGSKRGLDPWFLILYNVPTWAGHGPVFSPASSGLCLSRFLCGSALNSPHLELFVGLP